MGVRLDHGDDDLAENHEINVTPFIDVILVLLIIFMVAAPLATVDVPVDLPASTAAPQPRPDKPMFLTVKSDLSLALGDAPVARDALGGALDAAAHGDRETRIFLRADRSVDYGALMEVMNALRAAGYLKVALVGLDDAASAAPGAAAAAPAAAAGTAP
ncbi:TonB system transport protein ExbD [Arenibaculum pallidiluteum]|uniref:TonB system transport protein ExbD n=1 Tax=Arenibaculum pallidiluteum TaxID=2812559 RepID=UPI001A962FE1|nr:TonB system transport protein ExbD [Arenibaculum pallidiluteum]